MKILGISTESYHTKYIAEISLDEIAEIEYKSYGERGELSKRLQVGSDYPIAEGYDFYTQILQVTKKMEEAYESFVRSAHSMSNFSRMLKSKEEDEA